MDRGMSGWGRLCAAAIALCALGGIALFFQAVYLTSGSAATAATTLLAYFTITTNLLVALVFSGAALGLGAPRLVAATTLAVALVGVVFALLLRGLQDFAGGSAVANVLLHQATPALAPLFWLAFVPKGALTPRDPWLFGLYPLAYFGVALLRGAATGAYPYPFMNLDELGPWRTLANVAIIAAGFIVAGYGMLALDRRLGRRRRSGISA